MRGASARGVAPRAGGRSKKKMLRSGGPLFEDDEELSLLPRGNLSRRRSSGGGCCQLCRRACVCTLRLGLFCAAAVCAVAVALLYIGPRSGTRSKVHTLETEVLTQRKQLERLRSQLARGATAPGPNSPCIDRWEVQYPAELDVWNGHSCMWKQMWGQCDKFARQCRRTCGRCVSASEQGGGEEQEAEEEGEAEEAAAGSSAEDARQAAGTAAVEPESPVPKPAPGPGADAQAARVGGDAESLLQALRAREENVRLGKPGSALTKPSRAVDRHSQTNANGGETAQEGDDDDDDRTEEIDGDVDKDEDEGEDGEDGASYGQALSAAKTLESARRPASKSSAQPSSDRQNYVAGDSTTVVSAGSECGIPTQSPAASKGLDMGVLATKNFGADSRSYSSVTYLSSLVSMQPGEVHHYQHSVQLPRPAEARGIQSYVMEILEQRGSELRPAPEAGIHLKRFMLQQQAPPGSGRSCDTQAVLFAGEGARGAEVTFPHPFVVQPVGDTWHAQLHVVRTDGLTIPLSDARQCICAASWLETYGSLARMQAYSPRLLWPSHPPFSPSRSLGTQACALVLARRDAVPMPASTLWPLRALTPKLPSTACLSSSLGCWPGPSRLPRFARCARSGSHLAATSQSR